QQGDTTVRPWAQNKYWRTAANKSADVGRKKEKVISCLHSTPQLQDLPPLSSPTTTFYVKPPNTHPSPTTTFDDIHNVLLPSIEDLPPLSSPTTTFYVKPPNTHPSPTTTFDDIHNVLLPSIEDLPPLSSRQPPST
ncbi:hypothetical protein BaRGS_00006561, partial [Batillaria attramentaria]